MKSRDPALIFRACELRREGKLMRQIAAELGQTVSTVSGWTYRYRDQTVEEIAARQAGRAPMLTPEREATLRQLRDTRRSVPEIARLMNVSRATIANWVEKLGLPMFVRGQRRDGETPMTIEELAARDARMFQLRASGMTWEAVAREMNCSGTTIRHRMEKLRERGECNPNKDHSKPAPDKTHERKSRHCLMCTKQFVSGWPGERVCKRCKSTAAWRSGTEA